MGILAWLLFGLIAGAIAQLVVPGDDPGGNSPLGWLVTIAIGVIGAVVGGFIATALGFGGINDFDIGSVLLAVGGAILVLLLYRAVFRGRGRRLAH